MGVRVLIHITLPRQKKKIMASEQNVSTRTYIITGVTSVKFRNGSKQFK